jgi:glycosyltransferase involved in cell wall biosynthesis
MAENNSENIPIVSVIIPTYNRRNKLSRAIASVLSQTFQDFEIIVVDDGSTDDTKQFVMGQSSKVRYLYQANAGPGSARNHGIRFSRGKYLAFLDSDDVWMPAFLQATVSALVAHPDLDLASTTIYIGSEDKKTEALTEGVQTGIWEVPELFDFKRVSAVLNGFFSGAIVVKKSVVEKYGGYYEQRCMLGEDVYLWLQVLLNHRIYRIREPLVWYDTSSSELSFSSAKRHFPLEPVLVDSAPIWHNCPEKHREFLGYWLASHALKSVHIQLAMGDIENVKWLVAHYPMMRTWKWDWIRIRFKLAFPNLAEKIRCLKSVMAGRR